MTIATRNPATGETLKTFEPFSAAEIDAAIALKPEQPEFRELKQQIETKFQ